MRLSIIIFAIFIANHLVGCRAMYEGFMATKREKCYDLIYSDQQECLQQADLSYEEYVKQREDRIGEKKDKL